MSARRVAVIGGGRNPEHDVALRGAAAVAAALTEAGHVPVPLTIGRDGLWRSDDRALGLTPASSLAAALLVLAGCDAAFPVLHGAHGEDGTLAALLDLAGVPVVGCGVRAGAIGMDKHATKAVAAAQGVAVADGVLVLPGDALPDLPLPLVVKPTTAGSSFGVSLVRRADELAPAVAAASAVGDAVLVERFVSGREVHVGVLERVGGDLLVTPPVEFVVPDGAVFDTSAKYDGTTRVLLPAPVPPEMLAAMRAAALRLFRAMGCAGLARFDFFVTADGVVLNEVNTMPGMTATSGFPRMCAAAGIDHPALVSELVELAISRHQEADLAPFVQAARDRSSS